MKVFNKISRLHEFERDFKKQSKRFKTLDSDLDMFCASDDGKVFAPVADWTEGQYRGWQTERFARRRVRAVRLTGTYDSGPDGRFHVAELEVLSAATIVPYALGNARYDLALVDPPAGDPTRKAAESYRGTGTLEVATFDPDGWAKGGDGCAGARGQGVPQRDGRSLEDAP